MRVLDHDNNRQGNLRAEGIIRYLRGDITVLGRSELERRVCECYAVVKKELDRLLPYRLPGIATTPGARKSA